jgi:hypothetical protein
MVGSVSILHGEARSVVLGPRGLLMDTVDWQHALDSSAGRFQVVHPVAC